MTLGDLYRVLKDDTCVSVYDRNHVKLKYDKIEMMPMFYMNCLIKYVNVTAGILVIGLDVA